jgi:hypothetical protein
MLTYADVCCRELNITGAALGKMCWSFPPLMSLSIDSNIKLKLRYLFRYMNVSKDVIVAQPQVLTLLALLVASGTQFTCFTSTKVPILTPEELPQLLAYSLRGRIYPRFKHINQIGAQGQASLSSLLSIPGMLTYADVC